MFEVDFKILNQKATPAIYADVTAAIPTPGFVGRLFVATDSPYGVFRDTGSAWVQIAGIGGGGSSTGVNGLNGTTNIGLGGTLTQNTTILGNFNLDIIALNQIQLSSSDLIGNSSLVLNNAEFITQTQDSNTAEFSQFVQNFELIQTSFNSSLYGLSLNDNTGKFAIGDYGNGRKYNSFVVNDDTNSFYFTTSFNQANTDQDLFYAVNASAGSRFVKIGDFNNYANGVSLIIDDANFEIYTKQGGSFKGIFLNYNSEIYRLGDTSTNINTDTNNNQIELKAANLILTGVIISNSATTTVPPQYFEININGVAKKIQIFNP